ncbi:MAG: HD domain-containing protein [bacterium]|nr:HD domain-containing protein [bacterium]
MQNRDQFERAVKAKLEPNIFNHSLAVEACMGAIYDYCKENNLLGAGDEIREEWQLAGLIHDIDYAGETKSEHPNKTREVLAKYGIEISDTVDTIVKAHAPSLTGVQPKTKAQWAVFCVDSLTGLITAVAYVYPSKKLADVKTSSVLKRFLKEPKFAAGTRRDEVAQCVNPNGLNISIEKFVEINLVAMQKIAGEIGL